MIILNTESAYRWEVERNHNKWELAIPFDTTISKGHEYAHSITKTGALFFSGNPGGRTSFNIARAEPFDGLYSESKNLPITTTALGMKMDPMSPPMKHS